jgi:protein-disulfide isomerase
VKNSFENATARKRRQQEIAVVVVVFLIAAVGAGVFFGGRSSGPSRATAVPSRAIGGLALPVGRPSAPVTLVVFEDPRCPACKSFEDGFGSIVTTLVAEGALRVEYHMVSFIDGNVGGGGSRRGANALACAAEAGALEAYHQTVFANQPPEETDGFTDARLIELAGSISGLSTDAFRSCVTSNRYAGWVTTVNQNFSKNYPGVGTPYLILDGKPLRRKDGAIEPELASPKAFAQSVRAAVTR